MIEDEKEGIRWYWYTTQNKTVFVIIPVLCQLLLRNPKQNPTIKITYDFGLKKKTQVIVHSKLVYQDWNNST